MDEGLKVAPGPPASLAGSLGTESSNVATLNQEESESPVFIVTSQDMSKSLPELLQQAGSSGIDAVHKTLGQAFFSYLNILGIIRYDWDRQQLWQQIPDEIAGQVRNLIKTLTPEQIYEKIPKCDSISHDRRSSMLLEYGEGFYRQLFSDRSLKSSFLHILEQILKRDQAIVMCLLGFTTELERDDWNDLMQKLYQHYKGLG